MEIKKEFLRGKKYPLRAIQLLIVSLAI